MRRCLAGVRSDTVAVRFAAARSADARAGSTSGSGSLLALTAPSLTATSGVRIQGSAVAANGIFTPGPATAVTCAGGSSGMTLQPYSAVILTCRHRSTGGPGLRGTRLGVLTQKGRTLYSRPNLRYEKSP